jgi:hypothetical protein
MDTNAYLGVVGNKLVGTRPLIGSLDNYNRLCLEQLRELWSRYGNLAEVRNGISPHFIPRHPPPPLVPDI